MGTSLQVQATLCHFNLTKRLKLCHVFQLAQPDDDDVLEPTAMRGQQLSGKKVVSVSGGGQHTVLLAQAE